MCEVSFIQPSQRVKLFYYPSSLLVISGIFGAVSKLISNISVAVDLQGAAVFKVNGNRISRNTCTCDLVKRDGGKDNFVAVMCSRDCVGTVALQVVESIFARAAEEPPTNKSSPKLLPQRLESPLPARIVLSRSLPASEVLP